MQSLMRVGCRSAFSGVQAAAPALIACRGKWGGAEGGGPTEGGGPGGAEGGGLGQQPAVVRAGAGTLRGGPWQLRVQSEV
jgi:hypothetical protein